MEFFKEMENTQLQNIPVVFCIVIETEGSTPRKAGAKMLVKADGTILGTIGGGSIESEVIKDAQALIHCHETLLKTYNLSTELAMHCGGKMTIFFECMIPAAHLIIFGAGHIGKALSKMAGMTGFRVSVTDDRPGIFSMWTNDSAEKLEMTHSEALKKLTFSNNTYIVACTYQHEYDTEIIKNCMSLPHKYLGMIGSRRKVDILRKKMSEEFGFTQEQIATVDMPIGMPIACETPEEIAVSILGRLIDVKNKTNEEN